MPWILSFVSYCLWRVLYIIFYSLSGRTSLYSCYNSKIEMLFCSFLREMLIFSFMLSAVFLFPFLMVFQMHGLCLQADFIFTLGLLLPNLWIGRLWPQSPLHGALLTLPSGFVPQLYFLPDSLTAFSAQSAIPFQANWTSCLDSSRCFSFYQCQSWQDFWVSLDKIIFFQKTNLIL